MVTLAIFGVIMSGVLILYGNAQRAYFVGSEAAEIQGDARVAIDQMTRDIRKAGRDVIQCAFDSEAYTDCSGAKLTRCQGLPGFGGWPGCNNVFIIPTASTTTLQVQMDLDGDAQIDTSAPSQESVTFAFDGANRRITRAQGTGTAQTLAENIDSLTFTYEGKAHTGAGVCTGAFGTITPGNQTDRDCIQRVNIALVARATVGGEVIRRTLAASIDLRSR
jgi:type II secretory pathway pseudopilin PulG